MQDERHVTNLELSLIIVRKFCVDVQALCRRTFMLEIPIPALHTGFLGEFRTINVFSYKRKPQVAQVLLKSRRLSAILHRFVKFVRSMMGSSEKPAKN